jgi:ADP-ribose pyrophosphatase
MDKTHFTKDDYKIVKREVLHEGFFRLVNYHLQHRKFNGEWSNTYTREVHERPTAAGVLLYDPNLDKVVLIEQFRAGAFRPGQSPWLLEVVAGIYDEKLETPEEVAIREAKEEAGAEILDLQLISDYFVSPGGTNEYLHLYCGKVDAAKLGGIHGLPNENEDIRAFTLPRLEAFQLVKDGKIKTAPVIIALQWLQLNYQWLRELWLKNS